MSKAQRGVRQYQLIPPIKDVELFGLTCMKWWHKIQPHFRQNGGELLPLPNVTQSESDGDPWVTLRKSGPNGLVIIILLLSWWGNHAISGTETEQQWRDTITDVQRVLQKITILPSNKRLAPDPVFTQNKKR